MAKFSTLVNRFRKPGRFVHFLIAVLVMSSCAKKQAPKVPILEVEVTPVLQQDIILESEFTGQTYGASDIKIAPRVYGLIQTMDFNEGTLVKEGDLLYTIDPLPYQNKVDMAASSLAEANTMMVKAKADLDMIAPLAKINAVSQRELLSTKAQYEASVAKARSAEAALRNAEIELSYCSVVAPISGLIGISKVRVGDYVSQGPLAVLNTISLLDSIRVRFTISEQEYIHIQNEAKAQNFSLRSSTNKLTMVLSDGSIYAHPGKLSFSDRQIDPSTGAITIEAGFPNPDKLLRPGQFVRLRISTSERKKALIIPQRAVIEMQGIYQVYALGDSNKVHMKMIKPGPVYKDGYLVEEGVSAGEKIAFGGTQMLKNGSKIQPKLTEWKPGQLNAQASNK